MKKLVILFLLISFVSTLLACNFNNSKDITQEEKNMVLENIEKVTSIEENIVVKPLESTLDIEQLEDCTVAISFDKESFKVDETGTIILDTTIYVYDLYDMIDISRLKEGDTIVHGKNDVLIYSIERKDNGFISINGGLDNGGFELRTDDNTVYYEIGYSDLKSYYKLGKVSLPISPNFTFEDNSNLDNDAIIMNIDDLMNLEIDSDYYFNPNNTSIRIEDGNIVAMTRVYTP